MPIYNATNNLPIYAANGLPAASCICCPPIDPPVPPCGSNCLRYQAGAKTFSARFAVFSPNQTYPFCFDFFNGATGAPESRKTELTGINMNETSPVLDTNLGITGTCGGNPSAALCGRGVQVSASGQYKFFRYTGHGCDDANLVPPGPFSPNPAITNVVGKLWQLFFYPPGLCSHIPNGGIQVAVSLVQSGGGALNFFNAIANGPISTAIVSANGLEEAHHPAGSALIQMLNPVECTP